MHIALQTIFRLIISVCLFFAQKANAQQSETPRDVAPPHAAFESDQLTQKPSKSSFFDRSYQPPQPFNQMEAAFNRYQAAERKVLGAVRTSGIVRTGESSVPDTFQYDLGTYLRSGINLSNVACADWLQALGRSDRDTSFHKDIVNIFGNAVIGIAGINGASSASLARGALGMSAINASFDSFRNEIILGTISDIEAKLNELRKLSASAIRTANVDNYDDAKAMLIEYHSSCSPTGVKQLLKGSLAASAFAAPDISLHEPLDTARASVLREQLTTLLYGGKQPFVMSDDDLYSLYLLSSVSDPDAALVKRFTNTDSATLVKKLNENKPRGPAWLAELASRLKFNDRYAQEVQDEKTRADAKLKADVVAKAAQEAKLKEAAQQASAAAAASGADRATVQAVRDLASGKIGSVTDADSPQAKLAITLETGALKNNKNPELLTLRKEVLKFDAAQKAVEQSKTIAAEIRQAPSLPDAVNYSQKSSTPISITPTIVPAPSTSIPPSNLTPRQ